MKLLIIDDNKEVCEGIRNSIDWEGLGIHEVKTAENGMEGLTIFREFMPEIVLSDVMMPKINGLAFLKNAKQMKPETKVLMLSGYSEFEYAVEALKYGASGYELKPFRIQQLIVTISKLIGEIQKESEEKQHTREYAHVWKENLLKDIIYGRIQDKKVIQETLEEFKGIKLGNHILVMVARVYQKETKTDEKTCRLLERLVIEALDQSKMGLLLRDEGKFLIYQKCSASILEQITKQAQMNSVLLEINSLAEEYGSSMSAGVGRAYKASEIAKSVKEAEYALKLNEMADRKGIFIFKDVVSETVYTELYRKQREIMADWKLESVDVEDYLNQKIEGVFHTFYDYEIFEKKLCLKCTTILFEGIRRYFSDKNCLLEENDNWQYLGQIEKLESIKQCIELCKLYTHKLSLLYQKQNEGSFSSIVKKIRIYVLKHYQEEISIGAASELVEKSPNYVSHIFKQECGISFSEFVNQVRIEKAKDLLETSNLLLYEIAESVGYENYIHFTQVFKKYTGMSPAQFRKRNI